MRKPIVKFLPVTTTTYPDFLQLFEGRGGPKFCWCMVNRPMDPPYSRADSATKKQAITQYITDGTPIGILAYDHDDQPIAWCSIAPIESHKNLRTKTYKPSNNEPQNVWSISCFFIKVAHRRQGLTSQLAKAAINYAKQNGAETIEAYPVDYDSPSYTYMGRIGTFRRLGFKEIGMVGTRRHMMRLFV